MYTPKGFVRMVARLNYDGEEREDGTVFDQENDDLYETMIRLIHEAREIVERGGAV